MKKRILALSLSTVMALSALAGVLIAHKMTIGPAVEETAMVVDEEPSREVLAANYTQEDLDRVAKEAFDIINKVRKENGLSPFTWGDDAISQIRANEITEVFSHYSESGVSKQMGENCARTNSLNAQHVVDLWMNSPGHKAAILDYFDAGSYLSSLAVVQKDGRYYWVENFYTPKTYEKRLSEYEQTYGEIKKKEETKPQPSSAAAEVKQEEQKPATEVKQETKPEVKQETKPEVKEEQKPATTPEVKQEDQAPAPSSKAEDPYNLDKATGQKLSEEEQRALAEKYPDEVEKNPEKKETSNSQAQQETKPSTESQKGQATGIKENEAAPGTTIFYDEETDQRYELAPGQNLTDVRGPSSRNEDQALVERAEQLSGKKLTPIGDINEFGERVLSRTINEGENGEVIVKEDTLHPEYGWTMHSTFVYSLQLLDSWVE